MEPVSANRSGAADGSHAAGPSAPGTRTPSRAWLAAILVLAAALRLIGLDSLPPALSADEASNAYDGYCLLETHSDRWGRSWPIVLRAFGDADYRPALIAYLTVPFQAVLGPRQIVTAARLPAAILGVVTVLCLYSFAGRLFGRRAGLIAALLLALSPWHVVMSRLAHESALTPMFPVLILLLLQRGGVLPGRSGRSTDAPGPLRWPWMIAAGIAVGLSPYSYASMKLFVPALLLGIAILYRSSLRRQLGTARNRWALLAAVAAAAVVAGPMIKLTATDWDRVNARALSESLFHTEPTFGAALGKTVRQYAAHFGPDWLFITGHPYVDQSPRGFGQLQWYSAVLLPLGLVAMLRYRRQNRGYALVLLWLILYPIASATTHGGVNAARAAAGVAVFPLIGAIGLATLWDRWLHALRGRMIVAVVSVLLIALVGGRFIYHYFAVYPNDPEVQARYQLEFRQAMDYLRDRRQRFDHVFISDRRSVSQLWHTSEAYIFPLTYLPIEPEEFHAAPKVEVPNPPGVVAFHYIARFGDFTFTIDREALAEYARAFPTGRILLIARPGEVQGGRVVQEIHRAGATPQAGSTPALQLVAVDLSRETPRITWERQ